MRIQTQGYSNKVWLSSDAGVIQGILIMSAPTLEKILQAVNEKYGTSLEGWSQLPTAYEVGDTVPNWDAYEKIELPESKEYLGIDIDDGYTVGYLENEKVYLYSYTYSGNIIVCSPEGRVYQGGEVLSEELRTLMTSKLNNAGIQFNEFIGTQSPYQPGETIENWENYRKIS